jgi:hypothetical protein
MSVSGRIRSGGVVAAVLAAALVLVPAGGVVAQSVDCDAPPLERIGAKLAVAQAAVVAGNREALQAAIESARAQLDAIADACFGATASPAPSLLPVDLTGSTSVGGRAIAFPGDLEVVEGDGLMRSVDRDGVQAETLTVSDSQESGQLLSSQPEEPVPAGFRVISLAVGDPVATLAAVGSIDADDTIPNEPVAALDALVAAIEEQTNSGDIDIAFTEPDVIVYSDGIAGAAVDLRIRDTATDETFVSGMFQLRPLPDGDWALGVAFAAPSEVERIRADMAATLTSIGARADGA